MRKITEIIRDSHVKSKQYFKKTCQKKIESFEKKMLKKWYMYCEHCKRENMRYTKKGRRWRKLKTSHGVIEFSIQQVRCKECKKISRPILPFLWIAPRKTITEEFLDKTLEIAVESWYNVSSRISEVFTEEKISPKSIGKHLLETSEKIRIRQEGFWVEDWEKEWVKDWKNRDSASKGNLDERSQETNNQNHQNKENSQGDQSYDNPNNKDQNQKVRYQAFLVDSTKGKTGKTKRGEDITVVYGIKERYIPEDQKSERNKRQYLDGDILMIHVGNGAEEKIASTIKRYWVCWKDWENWENWENLWEKNNVMSDGEISRIIKSEMKNIDDNDIKKWNNIRLYRCHWHLSRMFWFALYNNWLKTKKERIQYVQRLASIIKYSHNNYKEYYQELIQECKEKELKKAVSYLENARDEFYLSKENPIVIDGISLLANSPIERVMREIDRRIDNGSRWSSSWMEAVVRVRLELIYNRNKKEMIEKLKNNKKQKNIENSEKITNNT